MTGYTTHNEESRFANCIENKQAKKETITVFGGNLSWLSFWTQTLDDCYALQSLSGTCNTCFRFSFPLKPLIFLHSLLHNIHPAKATALELLWSAWDHPWPLSSPSPDWCAVMSKDLCPAFASETQVVFVQSTQARHGRDVRDPCALLLLSTREGTILCTFSENFLQHILLFIH